MNVTPEMKPVEINMDGWDESEAKIATPYLLTYRVYLLKDRVTADRLRLEYRRVREALNDYGRFDNEREHAHEDALRLRFIHDLALGRYEMAEAIEIARLLRKLSRLKWRRWYA